MNIISVAMCNEQIQISTKYILMLVISMFFCFPSFGQSISVLVGDYFAQVRDGKCLTPPKQVFENSVERSVLDATVPFLADTVPLIRSKAYGIIRNIGHQSQSLQIQNQVVGILVASIHDEPDASIVRLNVRSLTRFSPKNFTKNHRQSLVNDLSADMFCLGDVAKLIGYLQVQSSESRLVDLSNQPQVLFKDKWAIHLSLARMGNQVSIDYISTVIPNVPVDDRFAYEVVSGLIYTRNQQLFSYVREVIMDDSPNCLAADPDSEASIPCAYRVIEQLSYVFNEFPLEINAYGDVIMNDPPAALRKVRDWLVTYENYPFNTSTF